MDTYSHKDNKNTPLDLKLDKIFNNKTEGVYIELGASDGLFQSNTAFFEKHRGWRGILIEPCYGSYLTCKLNRPKSACFNYACVSKDYKKDYVEGDFLDGHPMASIDGGRRNCNSLTRVRALPLEKIIDKVIINREIDFLSIDVEGYELNILKGLNLKKYRPVYILIEIYKTDYTNIVDYLKNFGYLLHSNFTNYNLKDNPQWDGTHQDYLFYIED
tara:strand:+ start:239 stop:886 length:648 start_codon:yes stop_codon:yes gene_type:complete